MAGFVVNAGKSSSDRRLFPRFTPDSLAYVEIGDGNGGIVVNISEGGLALQSAVSLLGTEFPRLRLQVGFKKHLEMEGKIAWIGDYRKRAGIRFVDLSEETRSQIREWILLEARPRSPAKQKSELNTGSEPIQTASARSDAQLARKTGAGTTIMVGILALAALGLGWNAGHHGLHWAFVKGAERKAGEILPEETNLPQSLNQIEILDLENHRWLIPFRKPGGPAEKTETSPLTSQRMFPIQNRKGLGPTTVTLSEPKRPEHAPQELPLPPAPRTFSESDALLPGLVDRAIPKLPEPPFVSLSTSVFQPAELIHRVDPGYPTNALLEGIEGTVKLHIVIGDDGVVREVRLLSGPQFLFGAAAEAVKRWRYKPALLHGHAIQSESDVTFLFSRSQSRQ